MSINNNSGHYTTVSGWVIDFDEPTGKFIMSITIEGGIIQIKMSEEDMLGLAIAQLQCIQRSKGIYQAENLR